MKTNYIVSILKNEQDRELFVKGILLNYNPVIFLSLLDEIKNLLDENQTEIIKLLIEIITFETIIQLKTKSITELDNLTSAKLAANELLAKFFEEEINGD